MADNRDRDRPDWNDDPASTTRPSEETRQQGRSGLGDDRVGSNRQEGVQDQNLDDTDEMDDEDRDDDLREDGSPNRRRNIG
jgi:hypothetical protein